MSGPWRLHSDVFEANGRSETIEFFVKRSVAEPGKLRWYVKHVLQSFGFVIDNKHSKTCIRYRDNEPAWTTWLQELGLPAHGFFGLSIEATKRTAPEARDFEQAEPDFWMSTAMIFFAAQVWYRKRRVQEQKLRVFNVIHRILSKTFDPADVDEVFARARNEHLDARCEMGDEDGTCPCARHLLDRLFVRAADRSLEVLARLFCALEGFPIKCPVACQLLGRIVLSVAAEIDERVELWGDKDLGTIGCRMGPSGVKRCRIDPSISTAILIRAGENQQSVSLAAAAAEKGLKTSTARTSLLRHLNGKRAESLLSVPEHPGSLASQYDAFRVGKPAREYLIHIGWDPELKKSLVFPPKVTACPKIMRLGEKPLHRFQTLGDRKSFPF